MRIEISGIVLADMFRTGNRINVEVLDGIPPNHELIEVRCKSKDIIELLLIEIKPAKAITLKSIEVPA